MIVEVIQSDLAPRDDFGLACELLWLVKVVLLGQRGFVGMNAYRGVNTFMLVRELDSAIECACSGAVPIADGEDGHNARCFGVCEYLCAIGVKALAVEMGVGVGVHQWSVDSG